MMAAALYFRGDALVTGVAGAQLWGTLDTTQQLRDHEPIRVLLVGRNATPTAGVTIHRTKALSRQDIRWRDGIPVTSPARTILDCAGEMDELELEAVLSAALGKNLVRTGQLRDVMERNPRAKGIRRLRSLLGQAQSFHDTRSVYERRFLNLLTAAELPLPVTNTWVAGKLVDGVWPDLKLVLEIDGWKHHGRRDKFESDRVRDQHLMIAGHHVIRVTRRQIDFRPHALVARTASMIAMLRLSSDDSPAG
jgi:very-short-patch-repair endonuclease